MSSPLLLITSTASEPRCCATEKIDEKFPLGVFLRLVGHWSTVERRGDKIAQSDKRVMLRKVIDARLAREVAR